MDIHLYKTAEDLPQNLRSHVRQVPGSVFLSFHHPFLVDLMPLGLPAPVEEVLEVRAAHAHARLAQGSASGYIFGLQRPYRLPELIGLARQGHFGADPRSAIRFWQLAASVWMDAEEDEASPLWGYLLATQIPHRGAMTASSARRALRGMKGHLTVYRGLQAADEQDALDAACKGYSWSLSHNTAAFFARRYLAPGDEPWIATAEIATSQVIAYLTRRGESEILIDSDQLDPDTIRIEACEARREGAQDLISLQSFFAE